VQGVGDAGGKFISSLASLVQAEKGEDIERMVDSMDDPAGYLYRFSQAVSILGNKKP
jgi:hypothetical protein